MLWLIQIYFKQKFGHSHHTAVIWWWNSYVEKISYTLCSNVCFIQCIVSAYKCHKPIYIYTNDAYNKRLFWMLKTKFEAAKFRVKHASSDTDMLIITTIQKKLSVLNLYDDFSIHDDLKYRSNTQYSCCCRINNKFFLYFKKAFKSYDVHKNTVKIFLGEF